MNNNKIALEALKLAGYKNPTAIAEIISYVPNPDVALEMLLGIYEPTQLDYANRFRRYKWDSKKIYEITAIDELGNRVTCKEYDQKTQTVYYLTREDRDNKVYQLKKPIDYYGTGEIPANGYTERERSMEFSEFESSYSTVILLDEAFAKLEEWDNYGIHIEKDPTDLLVDI